MRLRWFDKAALIYVGVLLAVASFAPVFGIPKDAFDLSHMLAGCGQ